MSVFCRNCRYRGLSESPFCTFEDRFTGTGDYHILKKNKNRDGQCSDFEEKKITALLRKILNRNE